MPSNTSVLGIAESTHTLQARRKMSSFHEYFNRVGKDKKTRSKKEGKDPVAQYEEDAEGASDDVSEIWKALVGLRSELEGEGSDDDLDMGDPESAYDADEKDEEEGEEGSGDEGVIFDNESDEEEEEEPDEDHVGRIR